MYSKENHLVGLGGVGGRCRKRTFIKGQENKERHVIEEMKIEGGEHERGWEKTEKEKYRSRD